MTEQRVSNEHRHALDEVAALRDALAVLKEECDDGRCPSAQHERIVRLKAEAERDRLREALENVLTSFDHPGCDCDVREWGRHNSDCHTPVVNEALAALAESGE